MDDTYTRLACVGCGDRCAHKECKACGKTFKASRDKAFFCSAACRNADRARATCSCLECGKDYKPKSASRITYCSRACYFKRRSANATGANLQASSVYFHRCTVCDETFTARALNQTRCGKTCDKEHAKRDAKDRAMARHRQDAKIVRCEECSCSFCPVYGASLSTLCRPCADSRQRAARKTAKLMRSMRIRSAEIGAIDPIKVFERDGWKCQMCGIDTPKVLRGTIDARAPELDHLVALSLGGEHSLSNVACLCRRCNGLKSNLPLDKAIEVCCAAS